MSKYNDPLAISNGTSINEKFFVASAALLATSAAVVSSWPIFVTSVAMSAILGGFVVKKITQKTAGAFPVSRTIQPREFQESFPQLPSSLRLDAPLDLHPEMTDAVTSAQKKPAESRSQFVRSFIGGINLKVRVPNNRMGDFVRYTHGRYHYMATKSMQNLSEKELAANMLSHIIRTRFARSWNHRLGFYAAFTARNMTFLNYFTTAWQNYTSLSIMTGFFLAKTVLNGRPSLQHPSSEQFISDATFAGTAVSLYACGQKAAFNALLIHKALGLTASLVGGVYLRSATKLSDQAAAVVSKDPNNLISAISTISDNNERATNQLNAQRSIHFFRPLKFMYDKANLLTSYAPTPRARIAALRRVAQRLHLPQAAA